MPVASSPEGRAAAQHAVRLSQFVELRRNARSHHALYLECREQGEREASPTAAIIDSQSVKSAEKGPDRSACRRRGQEDQGQRSANILVDTLGLLLHAIVHGADIQDRDGGIMLLATNVTHPFLKKLFADQGPAFHSGLARVLPHVETEIIRRSDQVKGFTVPPQALDRRAHHRVAQSLPRLAKDWGELQSQRPRVLAPRFNPPHATKTL